MMAFPCVVTKTKLQNVIFKEYSQSEKYKNKNQGVSGIFYMNFKIMKYLDCAPGICTYFVYIY